MKNILLIFFLLPFSQINAQELATRRLSVDKDSFLIEYKYNIFGYTKQGNIGNWHFDILDGQPEEGFTSEHYAELYLETLKSKKNRGHNVWAIIPVYKIKSKTQTNG